MRKKFKGEFNIYLKGMVDILVKVVILYYCKCYGSIVNNCVLEGLSSGVVRVLKKKFY